MTVLGLVSLIVSIVALGVALHAESLAGDAKWKADEVQMAITNEGEVA